MALIAHYRLDGNAEDSGPNTWNLSSSTNVSWESGKLNQSAYFNLGDSITGSTSNYGETNQISVSAWIKPETADDRAPIVRLDRFYFQFYSDDRLATYWYGRSPSGYHYSTANSIRKNEWNHVTVVWHKTYIQFYINGLLDNTISNVLGTGDINNYINIGHENSSRRYKGNIDDVRIYNHALSQLEIKNLALMKSSAGLVAHYPFDEDLIDYSGNMLHLEPHGTFSGYEDAKINKALVFNGNDFYVDNNDVTNTMDNKPVTFSYWLKFTTTSNLHTITLNTETGGNNILLGVNGGKHNAYDLSNGHFLTNTSINDDSWHHVAVIFNGSKSKQYVDGVFDSEKSTTHLPSASDRFAIGQEWDSSNPSQFFPGSIDEVRIYNIELSEQEIKSLSQAKIAHYKFKRNKQEVLDSSRNHYNAKFVGNRYFNYTSTRTASDIGWSAANGYNDTNAESDPCSGLLTFEEALEYVHSLGGRLPTRDELENDATRGTGCSYDYELIWTCEKGADDSEHWVVVGRADQDLTPETRSNTSTAYVRMIADNNIHRNDPVRLNDDVIYNFLVNNYYKVNEDAIIDGERDKDAIEFDGDTYLSTNESFPFITDTDPYTLSAWIYIRSFPGSTTSGASIIGHASANGFGLQVMGSKINFGYRSRSNLYSNSSIDLNKWYFVTGVHIDNGTNYVYINGKLDASGSGPYDITPTTAEVQIGWADGRINTKFDGYLKNVQIHNTALSADEVYNLYIQQSNSIKLNYNKTGSILSFNRNMTNSKITIKTTK